MGFFDKLFKKPTTQEEKYTVTITDGSVKVEHPDLPTAEVEWTDIHTILLRNTSSGPWFPDLWLTLIGNQAGCEIPLGCKGYDDVYEIVSKYDGFNFENEIKSMSCTDDAEFLLWKR